MNIESVNLRSIEELALEISQRAKGRTIGEMQKRRAMRKGLIRPPDLFDRRTVWEHYAFHVGGRKELQFNIGYEPGKGGEKLFRHGLSFSLEPSRTVPDVSIFGERIQRFNTYIEDHSKELRDFSMWYRADGTRTPNYSPEPIPHSLVRPGVFIVIGATCRATAIDLEYVLDDFDRLVPLYEFVEGNNGASNMDNRPKREFEWTPGNNARVSQARLQQEERNVERVLRHNELQAALFAHLCDIYGVNQVSGEQNCGIGKFIDVAVCDEDEYYYYEIKTGYSSGSCVREAFGQLMEYSFWPGVQAASKLIVVGECPLDSETQDYLDLLQRKFSLPLAYLQFDLESKRLVT